MTNNYMTEQYMSSILQQYQQRSPRNSPVKTSVAVNQNYSQLNQFYANEELKRRQLNESLFKDVDNSSFGRQSNQTNSDSLNRQLIAMNQIKQMSRNPLITSDSFKKNVTSVVPQMRSSVKPNPTKAQSSVSSVRSTYFGQSSPQTRVRPQPNSYKAKIIDYSNVKSKLTANRLAQNPRPVGQASSVQMKRNVYPIQPQTPAVRSVGALQKAITSIGQKPIERPVMPKPILKKTNAKTSDFRLVSNPSFDRMTKNSSTNSRQISAPKTPTKPLVEPKNILSVQTKSTQMRDSLVAGYENEGIIQTMDMDKNQIFYCYYCNCYIKRLATVDKHCELLVHSDRSENPTQNTLQNGLNKKFILGQIKPNDRLESIGLKTETVLRMELDRIPIEDKHYYYMKGIRLKNPGGPHAYYCRFCEQPIESLDTIESHLLSESHKRHENRPTFLKFVSQTTEPIIGLQFITEYMCPDLTEPAYECSLCKCFEDAYDMYLHVCGFKHRINLLKQFNPNEAILNSIHENPNSIKEVKKRIVDLHRTVGTGAINKINNKPNMNKLNKANRTQASNYEIIDITDDDFEEKTELQNHFSIDLSNDESAADAAIVIQALKEAVVKYYLKKIPTQMRRVLMNKVMSEDEMYGNLSSMDISL